MTEGEMCGTCGRRCPYCVGAAEERDDIEAQASLTAEEIARSERWLASAAATAAGFGRFVPKEEPNIIGRTVDAKGETHTLTHREGLLRCDCGAKATVLLDGDTRAICAWCGPTDRRLGPDGVCVDADACSAAMAHPWDAPGYQPLPKHLCPTEPEFDCDCGAKAGEDCRLVGFFERYG